MLVLFYVVLKVDLVAISTWTCLVATRLTVGAMRGDLIKWKITLLDGMVTWLNGMVT